MFEKVSETTQYRESRRTIEWVLLSKEDPIDGIIVIYHIYQVLGKYLTAATRITRI